MNIVELEQHEIGHISGGFLFVLVADLTIAGLSAVILDSYLYPASSNIVVGEKNEKVGPDFLSKVCDLAVETIYSVASKMTKKDMKSIGLFGLGYLGIRWGFGLIGGALDRWNEER